MIIRELLEALKSIPEEYLENHSDICFLHISSGYSFLTTGQNYWNKLGRVYSDHPHMEVVEISENGFDIYIENVKKEENL